MMLFEEAQGGRHSVRGEHFRENGQIAQRLETKREAQSRCKN